MVARSHPGSSSTRLPKLRDGAIRVDQLRDWSAEFDRIDAERYAAVDFVRWIEITIEADGERFAHGSQLSTSNE